MKFSQRIGITPLTKNIQLESIDDELRIGLWNEFSKVVLNIMEREEKRSDVGYALWHHFFKWKIETIPPNSSEFKRMLNDWFFAPELQWYKIYDFIEYVTNYIVPIIGLEPRGFATIVNWILEREFSAYRFINGVLSPISNEHEKSEIESALNNTASFTHLSGCNIHLAHALKLLSDKTKPDYRNSIKESISAVESVAKVVSGSKKDELGTALTILKEKANLSAGLVAGFKSIYGWTSNSNGIRHGLMDESNCDFDDAKFMLVSCSAFVNYLIGKSQKAGIVLQ